MIQRRHLNLALSALLVMFIGFPVHAEATDPFIPTCDLLEASVVDHPLLAAVLELYCDVLEEPQPYSEPSAGASPVPETDRKGATSDIDSNSNNLESPSLLTKKPAPPAPALQEDEVVGREADGDVRSSRARVPRR